MNLSKSFFATSGNPGAKNTPRTSDVQDESLVSAGCRWSRALVLSRLESSVPTGRPLSENYFNRKADGFEAKKSPFN
ncbi:unnamed protein product [Notodromas monacha]|uniref:Uncharacterized protein n=1 Tax=Notodromas monacha TaxID=399045 RepID=A0A7R9GD57_9CRUS|nr:unnamed protein product [Notodromas monacha]CAG0916817.1 unnamed protein product [Notodromas monacha]